MTAVSSELGPFFSTEMPHTGCSRLYPPPACLSIYIFFNWRIIALQCCGSLCHIGEGNDTPLQYSCLENPTEGGAWWAAVHGFPRSPTRLSDFTFTFHSHALKEMATHSSVLAWRIPGTEEPGGLLSMGSHRVGHD